MSLLIHLFISLLLLAQPSFQKSQSSFIVKGDSSMHEWEMVLEDYTLESNWDGEKIQSIQFQCKVRDLKSGKSKMDDNAYEAMIVEKFPEISYQSQSIVQEQETIKLKGTLNIAGVKKVIILQAKTQKKDESIHFKGSHQINMEDHDLEAPTAMFGMMKVDPEVNLVFDLYFKTD